MITIRGINGDILTHFDNDVPDGNPYFEPVLTDDMESLVSSFSFSVPLELADTEHLVGLNQVLVKDRQDDLRLFVITDVHEVWTTVGGTLQVNCEDISINEMNNIIVSPFESLNFQDTLTKTFKDSGWTLKYGANWKDVDNTTFKVENYDNMRSVIASIVDTYGCQFKFMAQENQFGEITRVAEVYKSRGNDTGKYFYYDRDLLGIERDINHADIKTAIHPYYTGYDGKTYSLKGFAPANPDPDFKKDKASPLIINREASKLFDDGNSYRIMPYKTEVEGNPELVYREAIKELKKYAEPIYTYSVNVLLLQNMIGWVGEDIDLGDTVWMKERVGNRELGLEARVTAYEYHEDDPSKDVVTFSNFKEIDTTDVPELAERIFIAYANSEDGIIDFSITDSVGKAYMGVYTAAVSTQSTDPSTYSWTRIKGEDGVSAPTLNLTSSQQVMKFKSDSTPDGDQTIIFTALKQNSTETVTWEAIPYKGDIAQPSITLGGTGDVRSLTSADWNNEWTRVKVTVSMGSLKDIQTVVMVSDGATGASGKAIVGYVTNESTTFAASSDGTVTDYGNGDGKFVLYEGTNKVTSGVTFARVSQVGINLLINDTTGEYKVSNMTTDMAQASVSATYKGITITKFLSFSKSKQGAKGDKGDTGNDGIAGKDGIGLKSTTVTYAASASGTTAPSTGWQEQVPTVAPDNFLWTRTVWTYTDDTSETGYSVAKMGRDGAKGNDGIAGKDGVGIETTLIEYAVSTSGTTRPASGWSTTIPNTPQGQYLWTRTTWTYTDDTTEQGYSVARMGQDGARGNDGIAGKDGVGLKSTGITYAGSASGTTPPSTGWQAQVPTVPAGQYLWTKTVWTYTDNSNETGYSVARMGQNGNNGKDGIAGKDGVGIKNTVIEYAVNTSGTTRPTSGWSTSIPTVPQGQYLWTRTTWTYTDNTTEQGFTVARQGEKGDKGDKGDQGIAGPKGADGKTQYTHIAYADNANGGGFSQSPTGKAYIGMYVDFEELDSSDPKKYAWSLIKGADGEQGVAGPKGEDGRTPYFHTAYTNSTDFGAYDYSGNPNLMRVIKVSDFYKESDVSLSDVGYNSIRLTSQGVNRLSAFTSNNIPSLVSGKTYTISAKVKIEEGTTGNIDKLRVSYRKTNGGTILLHANTRGVEVGKETTIKGTATVNYEITDLSRFYLTIDTELGATISGGVIVSDIKIEEGSTATPYQPNLKDDPWYFSTVPLGENILRTDAGTKLPITTTEYQVANFVPTGLPYTVGQKYTFTMKATKPATQNFGIYLRAGSLGVGDMKPVEGLTDVWQITFTITQAHVDGNANSVNVFQIPQATKGTVNIEWAKLEKGDTRTPNIDDYKYLGNYTDFVQADSLNPTKYSWSLIKGANGTNGTNGIDAYSAFLTNEANTFAANPSGAVSDWSTGRGTFMVYKGTTRVTTGIAFAVESTSNATGTIDPTSGNYAVTGMSSDNATLTFKATIGSTVLTKTMTLSKSRQGVQGVQGTMGIAFYSPTAPTGSNVTDGATWFKTTSSSDNTIVSINTYKGGKWVSTPVASGALAVENLSAISATLGDITAGSLTGVDITGATFINPFDFVGLDGNHLKGSTIIKDSEIEISGIANEGDANARKFSKEIAPLIITDTLRDGSDNILSSMSSSSTGIYLTDNVGKTNAILSGFGLQLTDWSGSERFDGRLTAKALTNTPWKLLTLDSSMYEVAENNPPMYRIIYNLDGSRTIKYKGQFKLKTGYMKEGVEYYPFRKNGAGNATLLPDEVRPDQTEFAYAAAGVAPGQKTNAGGRIGVTRTPNLVVSPGLGEVLYFGISSLNYTVL